MQTRDKERNKGADMKQKSIIIALILAISMIMIPNSHVYAESRIDDVLTDFDIDEKSSDYSVTRSIDEEGTSVEVYVNKKGDEIIFDETGQLKTIMRINNMVNNKNEVVKAKTSKNDLDVSIEGLRSKGYIPREFECVSCDLYGQDMWVMFFSDARDGAINPYDAVKIGFDAVSKDVLFYNRIQTFSEKLKPTITEDEAIEIANAYLLNEKIDVQYAWMDVSLKTINMSDYYEEEIKEDNYILVYKIDYDENKYGLAEVLVDAATGKVVDVQYNEAYRGKAFYCLDDTSNSNNRYRKTRATNYNAIMNALGYSSGMQYLGQSSSSRTTIINYLNGSDSWAFTFSGHGSPTIISGKNINEDTVFLVRYTDVPGVWSFVVLDACSTASTSTWANAFGIYDYNSLGRSFMGWSTSVAPIKAKTFSNYFKSAMLSYPTHTVLSNVYTAIANIPDNDVYNVFYIGDRSTNGHK